MRRSRLLAAVLCLATLLTACKSTAVSETSSAQSSLPSRSSSSAPVSSSSSTASSQGAPVVIPEPAPDYTAYEVYCVEDGRIIVGENIFKRIAPASLTKLLTASVALKYWGADDVVTVGTELELVQPESSLCFISKGQRLKMYDLLSGLLMPSGNDAAYTVAVTTARKVSGRALSDRAAVKYFSILMNDFAAELGMVNSHFANPEGWDNDRHYTTVSDLNKIAKYALSVPEIREIVSTRRKDAVFESGETITWYNGNQLLYPNSDYYCENAIGMKTGFTDNAGLCLIAAFEKNGKTYIITVVGCSDSDKRYEKILELYEDI